MTDSVVTLRPMVPEDGEALVELSLASPDTGQIQIAPRYHLDAYQANMALHEDTVGVVAVVEGSGKIAGSGFVSFDELCYEGELRMCAWLHNLQVHPQYRRQGIAGQLAEWRMRRAQKRVGQEGVVTASIQKGNTGSLAVAQRWRRQFAGERRNGDVGMRSKRPRMVPGITVRPAKSSDFGLIAARLNECYDGWNFYSPHTASSLANWLAQTPFESPFRQYCVAEWEWWERGNTLAFRYDPQSPLKEHL